MSGARRLREGTDTERPGGPVPGGERAEATAASWPTDRPLEQLWRRARRQRRLGVVLDALAGAILGSAAGLVVATALVPAPNRPVRQEKPRASREAPRPALPARSLPLVGGAAAHRERWLGSILGSLLGGLAAAGLAAGLGRARPGAVVPGAAAGPDGGRERPAPPPGLVGLVRHVDATVPRAEWSTGLLLQDPADLPPLARRQRARTEQALAALGSEVALPRATWGRPLLRLLAAAAVAAALWRSGLPGQTTGGAGTPAARHAAALAAMRAASPAPAIAGLAVEIDPPAYTHLPPHFADTWQVRAEEGARVRFRVTLSGPVEGAALRFGAEDLTLARGVDGWWQGERRAQRGELYELHGMASGREVLRGPLARLDVVPDRPPEIQVLRPPPLTVVTPGAAGSLALEVVARDDYGVAGVDAQVVVAHGGGEQVTFRELRRALAPRGGGRYAAQLPLADLGFSAGAAGVEAYLTFEARDNREPEPGRTRSATLRILVPGADALQSSALGGGIVLQTALAMFRSERQIILDTRQLLRDEPRLAATELQRRAEGLGFDQRALRLRYGALLGEEVESGAAVEAAAAEVQALQRGRTAGGQTAAEVQALRQGRAAGAQAEAPPAAGAVPGAAPGAAGASARLPEGGGGGVEDEPPARRGGGGLAPPAAGAAGAASGTAGNGGGGSAESLAQALPEGMVHLHDSAESMAFLPEALRRGMREVLAAMWSAEGRLRGGRPRDALPFEESALRRLKEVQQSSRAYVAKAAFSAPEVDPARRLTGDLAAVQAQRVRRGTAAPAPLGELFRWSQAACAAAPPPAPATALQAAGEQALAAAALAGDREALDALALWRAAAGRPGCREARALAAPLWRLLGPPPPALGRAPAEDER